jgi:opacity protein-like surface antigen
MKMLIRVMLAALLACLPMAALAEAPVDQAVIDAFTDTWVGDGNEGYAMEIWYEDGAFRCSGTRFIDVNDGYSFEFESCAYDAEAKALVCQGGVLRHETYNEAEGKITAEAVATGFGATLTVDEAHHLHWTGSGDAIPDQMFASLDEVGEESWYDNHTDDDEEDDGEHTENAFVGDWMCDRATIYIDEDDSVYTVHITWGASAFETAVWDYTCTLDPATGALTGTGKQSTETYDENGERVATDVVYNDGAATFTLDGDALLWNDAKEDVAQGMRFQRVEPEGDDF